MSICSATGICDCEHKVKNGIVLEEASRDATLRHIRTPVGL